VHQSAVDVLRDLGFAARLHVAREDDPAADALLCFSRRSRGDVVVGTGSSPAGSGDSKVLGSAQRRLGTTVLQHGSLLLSGARAVDGAILHPGLTDLAAGQFAWTTRSLADLWVARLAAAHGGHRVWHQTPFAPPGAAAVTVRATRFLDPRWTGRR